MFANGSALIRVEAVLADQDATLIANGYEDLGRVTRDREFEAGFLRLASLLETKLHSSRSLGQVARQRARELSPVRIDVLLTFRAHDQRWAWHIPR